MDYDITTDPANRRPWEREPLTIDEALAAWQAADERWQRELAKAFGSSAGDARYTRAGRGAPGSELRLAHDAFEAWRVRCDDMQAVPS